MRERVEAWKKEGEYLKSHAYAALAIETAEAAAELIAAGATRLGLSASAAVLDGFPD